MPAGKLRHSGRYMHKRMYSGKGIRQAHIHDTHTQSCGHTDSTHGHP